jgi:hypothetical protein
MSQFFSFSRFGRLFSKHTTEQASGYLLATGVLLGGIGLVLGFANYMSSEPMPTAIQAVLFTMGLLAAGAFFTSTVFAPFGNKKQATAALLLPASHGEKYLVGWLYSLPVFMAIYVGCFFLIDSLALRIHATPAHPGELVQLFSGPEELYTSLVAYAVVNAVFLWGSIFFTRQHFVRMAFGVLLALVVLTTVNYQALEALLGRSLSSAVPFASLPLREGREWYALELPPAQLAGFALVPLGLMLLAWVAAYVRLKEKQI